MIAPENEHVDARKCWYGWWKKSFTSSIWQISHYFQGFIHPRWLAGFLNHQQYSVFGIFFCHHASMPLKCEARVRPLKAEELSPGRGTWTNICQGIMTWTICFGWIKQGKLPMIIVRDLSIIMHCFGLVSYNAPCLTPAPPTKYDSILSGSFGSSLRFFLAHFAALWGLPRSCGLFQEHWQ